MAYARVEDLLGKTGSIYKLVTMAARRAAEINGGAPKMVEADGEKASTVALLEIAAGKIKLQTK